MMSIPKVIHDMMSLYRPPINYLSPSVQVSHLQQGYPRSHTQRCETLETRNSTRVYHRVGNKEQVIYLLDKSPDLGKSSQIHLKLLYPSLLFAGGRDEKERQYNRCLVETDLADDTNGLSYYQMLMTS